MYRLSILVIALLISFSTSLPAFAQIEDFTKSAKNEGAVVSEIGVRNCSLVQKDRDVTVDCDITNGKGIQPDVRYAIQLIQGEGDERGVVDTYVFPETLQLKENDSVHKTITYQIPGFFQGAGELWVYSSNSEGVGLAMSMVGQVSASSVDGNFRIIPESCYLTVNGESAEKRYTLTQGVDLNPGELLVVNCDVTNPGRTSLPISAQFSGFRRDMFGAPVETTKFPYPTFAVSPGENEQVSFLVPLASVPQAYDAALTLVTADGKVVSNRVAIHYVIRGASATIQNITLDKDFYKSGSQAIVISSWTGSADGHRQSRFAEGSNEQAKTFGVTIKDGNGMSCGESILDIPENKMEKLKQTTFTVDITQDCYNPVVSVGVVDINGKSLVEKSVRLESSEQPAPITEEEGGGLPLKHIAMIIGLMIVIVLGVVGWRVFASKKANNIVASFFFAFILFGGVIGFGSQVEAATFQDVWDLGGGGPAECYDLPEFGIYCDGTSFVEIITTTFTVDLNKTTFSPGETIHASGVFRDSLCSDGAHLGAVLSATNSADGDVRNFSWSYTNENVPQSQNFTAPSTPGNYSITFNGGSSGVGQNAGFAIDLISTGYAPQRTSYTINYTVASACVPSQGSACYSSANVCGQSSAGTVQCDGSCTAGPQPADPADNCPADPGFQCPATACTPLTSGACGADNGLRIFSTPTRLCDQGTPSAVAGSGPWSWSCVGSGGGTTASCSALLAAPLPTASLSVNGSAAPAPVPNSSNLAVAWGSTNASTCSGGGAGWSTATLSGTQNVVATTNSVYTITCFNVDGAWAGQSVPVTVLPPPATGSLETSINGGGWTNADQTIDPGDTVSMRWSSTDATSCTGTGFNTGGATNSAGTSVTPPAPNSNTAYGVSCTGAGGTGAGDTLTISVRQLPNFNQPSVSYTPSTTFNPATGAYDSVSVVFQTANDGGSNTKTNASYQFQFDRGRDGYELTNNGSLGLLNQGASVNRTETVTGGIPFGNSRIRVAVDSNNAVNEINEGDNVRVLDFMLPPPDPGVNISADRIQLRNNETTVIRWSTTATYPTLSCTVMGPGMNVSPAPLTGNQTTQPITSKSEYTFRCTETTTNTTWTDSVMVETQGVIQET
jgi:hypothetical protein